MWEQISGFEKMFWFLAIPATVVFLIQTVLTIAGASLDHSDADAQHGAMGDGQFPIFTIRNLVVFFMMFGWMGIALIRQFHAGVTMVVAVSFLVGLGMMMIVSLMFWGIAKLTSSGNVVVDGAIVGLEAKVYLKIPATMSGNGKVTLVVQGVLKELAAYSKGNEIPTGATVTIRELRNDGSVIVGI